jgi:uncharacterized lipoprotein YddW (UPF0748 family)/predicted glycoside hydrolase/deacetylase ChbG (UPF0249 family)
MTLPAQELLVRGDDMGATHAINTGMIKSYTDGVMRSVEVMVVTPWLPEAVKLLQAHPGLDVGLHLTVTSEWEGMKWRPLTHCPSLTDEIGYFHISVVPYEGYPGKSLAEQRDKISLPEMEAEFRAQIDLALRLLPNLTHLSGHMAPELLNNETLELLERLAGEYGLPYVDDRGKTLQRWGVEKISLPWGLSPAERKAQFVERLHRLEPGKRYLFAEHPAMDTDEMRAIRHIGYENVAEDRQGVVDLFTDPEIKQIITGKGIKLINYGELKAQSGTPKVALMWFDATANFERFSTPDSIDFYLEKIKALGFTHAVVDMRPISGELLYESEYEPLLSAWKGFRRTPFDYLGHFIRKAHALGMEVHASLNVFVAGHNHFDRGPIYWNHPEWATMLYTPEQGIVPVTSQKQKYSAMANPINESFRTHILNILKEITQKYPALDGLILDRVRYDGISADFSEASKAAFEQYLGEPVAAFPGDIFKWVKDGDGRYYQENGKHFLKWIEWRAKVIYDFMVQARAEVKRINPRISFGAYTGAWYPSYFEVGVNFASNRYDPSQEYDWATPEYKNFGYAEVLDLYTTGNYYTDITKDDYRTHRNSIWNETDSRAQSGEWYCVEGSCEHLRDILKGRKFIGGLLVDQFYNKPGDLTRAIEMNLRQSDGVMIFDIVHIITKDLWKEVEEGMNIINN